MLVEAIGTGITAVMPLVTIAFLSGIIFIPKLATRIMFTVAALVAFAMTISIAVWYFNQPFSGEGMGWWYGVLAFLTFCGLVWAIDD